MKIGTIIKTQGIEFEESELMEHAISGKYIVKYNTVYQARYTENTGPSLRKVYKSRLDRPLAKRGRYHVMRYKEVNALLGFKLLVA